MRRTTLFTVALILLLAVSPLQRSTVLAATPPEAPLVQEDATWAMMQGMNDQLATLGMDYRVEVVEYLTASDQAGRTVFFKNVGNKQLGHHWVPGDVRRLANGTTTTYLIDQSDGITASGLFNAQTEAAIDRAMATWDAQNCSTIPLVKAADTGADPDIVDAIFGFGGFGNPFLADVVHGGWLPKGFFDAVAPGGGNFILGVTFTFVFVDAPTGNDINNDGKLDTALREIYYNDNFFWAINADFDVETVALHEAGHGLSQAHFGELSRTDKNGKFHFSPRAVMNAGYTGVQQTPRGTDRAGHCSIWGSWPNR